MLDVLDLLTNAGASDTFELVVEDVLARVLTLWLYEAIASDTSSASPVLVLREHHDAIHALGIALDAHLYGAAEGSGLISGKLWSAALEAVERNASDADNASREGPPGK